MLVLVEKKTPIGFDVDCLQKQVGLSMFLEGEAKNVNDCIKNVHIHGTLSFNALNVNSLTYLVKSFFFM